MLRNISSNADHVAQKATALEHPHIIAIAFVVNTDVRTFARFQYVRFTLEEMLYVHIKIDETQIRTVTTSASQSYSVM